MLSRTTCRNVRVTTIAVNRLTRTPKARLIANPNTKEAPNELPRMPRMKQVIKVEIFESRIEGQARRQASTQNETSNTGQSQCDRDQLKEREVDQSINCEC